MKYHQSRLHFAQWQKLVYNYPLLQQ